MVEGLGLSHLRETDWEAGKRVPEGLADGMFPGECSNPEPEILRLHPVTSNLPSHSLLTPPTRNKRLARGIPRGTSRLPPLQPSSFGEGAFARWVRRSWPSPPPTFAVSTLSFCVGNQDSHCPREKSICFRFVPLKELDRRSEVQMLFARAHSSGGGGDSGSESVGLLGLGSRARRTIGRKGRSWGFRLGR